MSTLLLPTVGRPWGGWSWGSWQLHERRGGKKEGEEKKPELLVVLELLIEISINGARSGDGRSIHDRRRWALMAKLKVLDAYRPVNKSLSAASICPEKFASLRMFSGHHHHLPQSCQMKDTPCMADQHKEASCPAKAGNTDHRRAWTRRAAWSG